jgi:hypothetical protein
MAELTPLAAAVGAYLADAASRPFDWGEEDCFLFPANWVRARTGRDGAARWRGSYADERGARRLLARSGGPAPLFAAGCAAAGLTTISAGSDAAGDVGLIPARTTAGRVELVGAVRGGLGWAFRSPGGVLVAPANPVQVWRI